MKAEPTLLGKHYETGTIINALHVAGHIDPNTKKPYSEALALGAKAALVTRPSLWGLATYGSQGVQKVIEMLQSEMARDMAMLGVANLAQITPAYVKVHRR